MQQRAGLATPALRRVLVVLCVTEIVSWGVLYYAFPVLAPAMSHDTGWSPTALTAGFSVALGISALVGVPVGRWLDRRGPRAVMTAGSVLAVPAVVVVATAPSLVVYLAGWVLAGIAAGGILYPPAFAALTRWWAPRQVVALTALTTVAGLSSTVFAPLTAALLGPLGWRGAYLVLAGILAVVTIPLHLWGLRGPWPRVTVTRDDADPSPVVRSRPFLLLAAALAVATLSAYAVLVNLVPLLLGRGLDTPTAALALGLGGVGQVVGRLGYRRLAAVTTPRGRATLVFGISAVTTALLGLVPGPAAVLVGLAILAGVVRGIFTLLQATAVADRWGTAHYGRLNGIMAAPSTVAMAVAPFAGTALAGVLGGYPAVFVLLAVLAAASAVLVLGGSPPSPPATPPESSSSAPSASAARAATSNKPDRADRAVVQPRDDHSGPANESAANNS